MRITTMLFVPGNDERKLAKMPQINTDAFILDLEDAVAHHMKQSARECVQRAIASYSGSAELHVRVNAFDSHYLYQDLLAITANGLKGIILPKVQHGYEVQAVAWLLDELERMHDLTPGGIEILPLIETVTGLNHVDEIASSSERIRTIGFGAHDFMLDLGIDGSSDKQNPMLVHAKCTLALACKRNGLLPPHDGAYTNFRDSEGLMREIQLAKSFGFSGKHAIHPDQVPLLQEAFKPTAAELEKAREVVRVFESNLADGVAAMQVDGQMIDYAVVEQARKLLGRS